MHDASHSRKANDQRDPNNLLSWSNAKRISMFLILLYDGSCNHRVNTNRSDAPTTDYLTIENFHPRKGFSTFQVGRKSLPDGRKTFLAVEIVK
jgi:hypothetical protein